jgi:hypothetical protein
MKNRAPKILLALMVAAARAAAQNTAPSPTEPPPPPAAVGESDAATPGAGGVTSDASAIVMAPKTGQYVPAPPVDSDGENRSVSPGIAEALSLGMPKYAPPTPTPTPAPDVDMRDVDRPKNEIKRLPKYVVRESRPPIFRDRDLFTTQGLIDLSFKNHPGLMFGNILGLNEAPAYEMFLDDQRQKNMQDLSDTAHAMARGGDPAEGAYILQASQNTYMRQDDDFTWGGPGGGGTNSGGWGK